MDEPEEKKEETPKLRVRRDTGGAESTPKECPNCNARLPEDAVLCVQCGYDFRSGTVHKASSPGLSRALIAIISVVAVILAAVAVVLLISVFRGDDVADTDVMETVDPVPDEEQVRTETDPPAPDEEDVAPTDEEPEAELPETEPAEEVAEPAEEEAREEEERETIDLEQRAQELRDSLSASLDDRVPMVQVGDEVALRRTNGLVHRGELVAIRDGQALIVDNEIRERVPLNELDRDSRLLVDREFRDRLVESRVQAALREME